MSHIYIIPCVIIRLEPTQADNAIFDQAQHMNTNHYTSKMVCGMHRSMVQRLIVQQ